MPISEIANAHRARCVCGPQLLSYPTGAYHAFSCGAGREVVNNAANVPQHNGPMAIAINRHNKIRDALASFLLEACTLADGVYKEYMLPPAEHRLRTDVAVVLGGSACYVDVVVTNPASVARFRTRRFITSRDFTNKITRHIINHFLRIFLYILHKFLHFISYFWKFKI
jgi:hypothetical protein